MAASIADAAGPGVVGLDPAALPAVQRSGEVTRAAALGWPLVIMTATPEEAEALQLLNQGALGCCQVDAAAQQLRAIALVVAHGGIWLPAELLRRFLALSSRLLSSFAPPAQAREELTSHELMVAQQVAKGASNWEAARNLGITERTVKVHPPPGDFRQTRRARPGAVGLGDERHSHLRRRHGSSWPHCRPYPPQSGGRCRPAATEVTVWATGSLTVQKYNVRHCGRAYNRHPESSVAALCGDRGRGDTTGKGTKWILQQLRPQWR